MYIVKLERDYDDDSQGEWSDWYSPNSLEEQGQLLKSFSDDNSPHNKDVLAFDTPETMAIESIGVLKDDDLERCMAYDAYGDENHLHGDLHLSKVGGSKYTGLQC